MSKITPEAIGPGCKDCAARPSRPDIYTELYCEKIKLDHDAKADTRGFTGERATCIGFDPNLITAVRFKIADASLLVYAAAAASPVV